MTNEAQDEALLDQRVQSRLRSDRAYLYAENAEEQADREREIEDEEIAHLADQRRRYNAERFMRENRENVGDEHGRKPSVF